MLTTGEGGRTDGTFVVASHDELVVGRAKENMTALFFVFSASASDLRSRFQCVGCDALGWEATTIRTAWVVLLTYHRFQCGSRNCINILPSYTRPQTICQLHRQWVVSIFESIGADWGLLSPPSAHSHASHRADVNTTYLPTTFIYILTNLTLLSFWIPKQHQFEKVT